MKLADCLPLLLIVTTVRCIRPDGGMRFRVGDGGFQIFMRLKKSDRAQDPVVTAGVQDGDIRMQTSSDAVEPYCWYSAR